MWSSGSSFAFSVIACLLSLGGLVCVAVVAVRLRELQDRLTPLPLLRLGSVERSLAELTATMQELANRVKMQRVRAAVNHVPDRPVDESLPDPYRDPDGWRKAMNERLTRNRHGL